MDAVLSMIRSAWTVFRVWIGPNWEQFLPAGWGVAPSDSICERCAGALWNIPPPPNRVSSLTC